MNLQGFLGISIFIGIAYLFSKDRKSIDWGLVLWGLSLQVIIAGFTLGTSLISLSCMFIGVYIIIFYNFDIISEDKIKNIYLRAFLSFLIASFGSYSFSLLGQIAVETRNFIWYIFLIIGFFKIYISNFEKFIYLSNKWSNYFGILICIAVFGTLLATGQTGTSFFQSIGDSIVGLLSYAKEGGSFYFGGLYTGKVGWIFAIDLTTSIIFFTTLVVLIDSLGILNQIIISVARFMNWSMKSVGIKPLSGIEMLLSISSIPIGVNNLLFVRNYLDKLTNSEIILTLTGIMATISAGMFAAFISLGVPANHILAASAMSIPAVIVLSKILVPETKQPITQGTSITIIKDENYRKPLSSIMAGINESLQIVAFMGGALIVFISLIAMIDGVLNSLDTYIDGKLLAGIFKGEKTVFGEYSGIFPGSLKTAFGYIFAPLAFFMGVPLEDVLKVGYLMGTKLTVNEFVAFTQLNEFMDNYELKPISIVISSFALCGYANPGTLAMVLGIVAPYIKVKKEDYRKYGVISVFLGAASSWMTASIASIFGGFI